MIHAISRIIAENNLLWTLARPFVKFGEGLRYYRIKKEEEPLVKEIKSILTEPRVLNGPFKNMQYPDFTSFGSAIYPKILGCYEREIYPFVETALSVKYDTMIDIGSAEGYYSVGFALKQENPYPVVAVDINKNALQLLQKIAALNGVADKITVQDGMDAKEIGVACAGKRNFIFCDCEGFEGELFTPENRDNLQFCDILIETHDSKRHGVSVYLADLFSATHSISRVTSTDNYQKLNQYHYPEVSGLSEKARIRLFSEGRGSVQEWLFCEAKKKK